MDTLIFKITNKVPTSFNICDKKKIHYQYDAELFLYYHFTISNYSQSTQYLQLNKTLRERLSKYQFGSHEHEDIIRRMNKLCPKAIEDFNALK